MNGWTTTKVWEVNGNMIIAKTVEDAIELYHLYSKDVEIESVKLVKPSIYAGNSDAIIKENKK